MKSFAHVNARSVDEAIQLLTKYNGRAKLNAGGTDLIGVLKDRILPGYPEAIINIKTIPGLGTLEKGEDSVSIGALTPLVNLIESPFIEKNYPLLQEAAKTVASPQVRNMATVGGNICQDTRCWYYRYPDQIGGIIECFRKGKKGCPAVAGDNRYHAIMGAAKCYAVCPSDIAVALIALGATLTIAGAEGSRTIPLEDFYTPLGNVLAPEEMIKAIRIRKPFPSTKQTFLKFTIRKPIDFAVVSVASNITIEQRICTRARIVLGAVAPTPVRAFAAEDFLKGKELCEEIAVEAAALALAGAKPLSKNAYKIEIAKTLVKEAILSKIK